MWRIVAVTLFSLAPVMLTAQQPAPFLPSHAIQAALKDCMEQGEPYRESLLYLWVPPSIEDTGLETLRRVLSGHVNGMSREPGLEPIVSVSGTGRLLRLSLAHYRWKRQTIEQFALVDPYFYTLVTEDWPGGGGYAAGRYRVPAIAPWAAEGPAKEAATSLLAAVQPATGKRQVPILSVTSFVYQTFVSTNGAPSYDDFLQVKTEKDFFKLGGIREDEDEALEAALLAVVAESGITLEPRAFEKRDKIGGQLWRSHDFIKATGKSNPFVQLGRNEKRELRADADAHENYIHLPNKLWAEGLFNRAGASQASAPDNITSGDTTTTNPRDHRVHKPLSCVRCHANGGLQDLDDWVRNLQSPPPVPPLSLQIGNKADPKNLKPAIEEAIKFRYQYGGPLVQAVEDGRAIYTRALLQATGMTPEVYASAYAKAWELLCEPRIDSAWAARDLGVSEAAFVAALQPRYGTHPVLAGFLKPREKQKLIQLRQWMEAIPDAQKALRNIVDADIKKE